MNITREEHDWGVEVTLPEGHYLNLVRIVQEVFDDADALLPCCPQDPELIHNGEDRCPADHPNCCGSCDLYYRLRGVLP